MITASYGKAQKLLRKKLNLGNHLFKRIELQFLKANNSFKQTNNSFKRIRIINSFKQTSIRSRESGV